MPKYKVTKTSLIENRIVEPGAVVEFDGMPGDNLEATDAAGKKKKAEYADFVKSQAKTPHELMGEAMADAIANPKKKKSASDADVDGPVVVNPGANVPTTIGHSSVAQVSVGGVDAENLFKPDASGKLVAENPANDMKPVAAADPK